jgi:hypothetical protein
MILHISEKTNVRELCDDLAKIGREIVIKGGRYELREKRQEPPPISIHNWHHGPIGRQGGNAK